jgi:hypothetical protein
MLVGVCPMQLLSGKPFQLDALVAGLGSGVVALALCHSVLVDNLGEPGES